MNEVRAEPERFSFVAMDERVLLKIYCMLKLAEEAISIYTCNFRLLDR